MFSHIHPDNYDTQLEQKKLTMQELFAEFAMPAAEVFTSEPLNYRLRAEFRVWHEGDDFYYIMFDQETKQKFRVDQFPAASVLINQAMTMLRENILGNETLKRKLYQVDFLSTLSGELLISLIYHKPLDDAWQEEANQLKATLSQLGKVDLIGRAKKLKICLDRDFVDETLMVNGKPLHYQQIENSFTQPNGKVNQKMLEWAIDVSKESEGDLVELYCGNGNFSIALAQNFKRVLATEISKTSVKSAQVNIASNKLENVDILRMSAEEFSEAMNGTRQFRRLEGFHLDSYGYDTVLVDPPRAGLDADGEELASRFKQIIYISCNPATLYDNLVSLSKTHEVKRFALFDQFPYTHHIECGVYLTKKEQ